MTASSHQEHDDAVHAEHAAALARGEQRVLYLTDEGMLHSYTPVEVAGPPNGSTRWWQNLPGMVFYSVAICLMGYLVVTLPAGDVAARWTLIIVGLFMAGAVYYLVWESVVTYRGRKERLRRGSPDPYRNSGAKTKLPESYTESRPIRKSRWS